MWEMLVTFLSTLGVIAGREYLQNRHVRHVAREILADDSDPTTDITDAVKEAWIRTQAARTKNAARALAREHEAGKLRIRESAARARENAKGIDATVVPRDGSEEYKPGWPL